MITLVEVKYQSILPTKIDYLLPVVKIEFSAMSLDEPFENREIATLIHSRFPEIDSEIKSLFKSVLPERTFLEKKYSYCTRSIKRKIHARIGCQDIYTIWKR